MQSAALLIPGRGSPSMIHIFSNIIFIIIVKENRDEMYRHLRQASMHVHYKSTQQVYFTVINR